VFISNVDNLGATVDLRIIYHLITHDVDFAMEVTDKTRGDVQVSSAPNVSLSVPHLTLCRVVR
jgi:UTP--glucose-1-phosphate uridylyltransferase